jgi:hypothetical protein
MRSSSSNRVRLSAGQGRRRDRDVARDLANRLVEQALTASLDRLQDTPFARAVRRAPWRALSPVRSRACQLEPCE